MSEVTKILLAIEQGVPRAAEQLLPLVYDELRKLAARRLAREVKLIRVVMPRAACVFSDSRRQAHFRGAASYGGEAEEDADVVPAVGAALGADESGGDLDRAAVFHVR